MAWSLAAVATFGVMEAIGLVRADDGYPPLTHVIREYLPRWLAFALILAATGLAAGTWFRFHSRVELALLTGLAGWFVAHFDTAYDETTATLEHRKYAWYADKIRHVRGR